MEADLVIKNLHVSVEDKHILRGVDLAVRRGEVHALMGPNGSGKSTLSLALMGHPRYRVREGDIIFRGESLLPMSPDARARKGLFLAFQYPAAVPGVSVASFLRTALVAIRKERASGNGKEGPLTPPQFKKLLRQKMSLLQVDEDFAGRYLNEGFSGGEKKRLEMLQLAMLEPQIAILDETDSGLDIDALRMVAEGVDSLVGPNLGVLVITHYQRMLRYIRPHFVHVLLDGRIVRSGGPELAEELEARGYDWVREEVSGATAG